LATTGTTRALIYCGAVMQIRHTIKRRRRVVAAGGLVGLWLMAAAPADAERSVSDDVRARLDAQRAGIPLQGVGGPLREVGEVQSLYAERVYEPVWFRNGRLVAHAAAFVELLGSAGEDGLRPVDYHAGALARDVQRVRNGDASSRAALELALTDALFSYATDMLLGRVRPESLFASWESPAPDVDVSQQVRAVLASPDPIHELRGLAPDHRNYQRLRGLLAVQRSIQDRGGWVAVPTGPALKPGGRSERVAALRQRLAQSGDWTGIQSPSDPLEFDSELETAVTRYQLRHGLEADGVAGAATIESLNVPVSDRIRTIEMNMERWRWLPRDLGPRFITVNIAGFELTLMEHGEVQLTMPVVVGKRYHATPVFSGLMSYLVFSPYWNVPNSIATREILPRLARDPGYLENESMKVFLGWEESLRPIDPARVDWSAVPAANFPYRFRQEPGPHNALGLVKFMFPNKYNVYLHDTPAKELFSRASRDFSHGCIRVKEPLQLAEYLLQNQSGWDMKRIEEAARSGVEQAVTLPRPWPVHILYWTAWVGERGNVHFWQDIYGRDETLIKTLLH